MVFCFRGLLGGSFPPIKGFVRRQKWSVAWVRNPDCHAHHSLCCRDMDPACVPAASLFRWFSEQKSH